eukprot:s1404_g5.t1
MVDMSKPYDPIWPVVAGLGALKKTDLRCVERMAESYNTDLFQDDSNPHEYFTDKECENSICGCLGYLDLLKMMIFLHFPHGNPESMRDIFWVPQIQGYQSPMEPIHQRFLDQGHSEVGEKQSLPQLAQRMNFANLRRFLDQPEPVRTWWDCNWPAVVGVSVPLTLMKAWERHQEALAQKRMGREQGREEARAYLRNANGYGAGAAPEGTVVGVVGVAPPAAGQMNENGWYQAKETE